MATEYDLGSVMGPQGIQGIKGDKGDTGATGPQGARGATGATGATGPAGPQGAQGVKGATGPAGPKGDKGDTGAQGPQGIQGIQGPKGATGATGATGPAGPKGDKGDKGATGPQGPKGTTGAAGPAGKSAYTTAKEAGFSGTEAQLSQYLSTGPWLPASGGTVTGEINMGNHILSNISSISFNHYGVELYPADSGGALAFGIPLNTGEYQPISIYGISTPGHASSSCAANKGYVDSATRKQTVSATLTSTGWTGSSSPYTQVVSVAGVTATSINDILPALNITASQLTALQAANIQDGGQAAGKITLKAFGTKPTVSIPIRVMIWGA